MSRLSLIQARELWRKAIAENCWQASTLEKVMFDWKGNKTTRYHANPPAFYSIANELETVDEVEFRALLDELIRRGKQFSNLGRARNMERAAALPVNYCPVPLTHDPIQHAIKEVMVKVHPAVVRQEQILRCALIAHLPSSIGKAIGTLSSNLHPEMPTASKTYQRKGKTKRRARVDVGFGHPTVCEDLVGLIEIKSLGEFSRLWFQKQAEKMRSTLANIMFSGLAGDFQKLLDPNIPPKAFRYSWAVTKTRGRANSDQVATWAESLLVQVEQRLSRGAFERSYDPATKWLVWKWPNGSVIHLAWYWPKTNAPDEFEPVWAMEENL